MPASSTNNAPTRDIYSVSDLNNAARDLLEGHFPLIWVEGEISNLARPASGHIYFSLKDSNAQLRCAMFKMRNRLVNFRPENGQQILVRGRLSLYPARGDYQLIAEHMEEAGDGALRRQFELLKHQLHSEGLFDADEKQPLPELPTRLGVITSPTGAAIRDILSVLKRRFPGIPVLIYPVPVQGDAAPAAIVDALQTASNRNECDTLILARGGGSLEDLWAFNNEAVARAIHACPIPVVSAIGHEVDFTIADFVADLRAPTPSAAAELVSPDREEWLSVFAGWQQRLTRSWQGKISQHQQHLQWLRRQLKHPGQRLRERAQRLDELEQRLNLASQSQLRQWQSRLNTLTARLHGRSPSQRLRELQRRLNNLQHSNKHAMLAQLARHRARLGNLGRALDSVSPLATLGRGYAIVKKPDGTVVRKSSEVNVGDAVTTQLGFGQLDCRIEAVHKKD
ncbi:MAG: exodeoxyribonuclease VII large subunit [Ectothiorhodospiraceae bacterium]|nr:exodeoxyribonuclease VII large subunit [Ectothiorhodospiraceae bacterium]